MIKPLIFVLIICCMISCELKNEPMGEDVVSNDSLWGTMGTSEHQPLFDFNSFSYADSLSDCACHFAITKNVFANKQYIFVAALEREDPSYMQFNGKWVALGLDSLKQSEDSLYINVMNDSLRVNVKTLQDSLTSNSVLYQGELQIVKEGLEDDFKVNIYGECFER